MTDHDLDMSKAMVYKTPDGWVAHCTCGPTLCGSWTDAIGRANLRTATHRNPAFQQLALLLGVAVR